MVTVGREAVREIRLPCNLIAQTAGSRRAELMLRVWRLAQSNGPSTPETACRIADLAKSHNYALSCMLLTAGKIVGPTSPFLSGTRRTPILSLPAVVPVDCAYMYR